MLWICHNGDLGLAEAGGAGFFLWGGRGLRRLAVPAFFVGRVKFAEAGGAGFFVGREKFAEAGGAGFFCACCCPGGAGFPAAMKRAVLSCDESGCAKNIKRAVYRTAYCACCR